MCRCSSGRRAGWPLEAAAQRRWNSRARLLMAVAALVPFATLDTATAATQGVAGEPRFGFGKPATKVEIAGWDIDVRPDGTGLPPGRGTVAQGQGIYDEKCASCHGTFGESNDYMALAGGVGTLGTDQPMRTIGSKLNYATTLWDYINRAMPFNAPKTLTADEVYALTAYVLHLNDLLPADGALDRSSLIAFRMPNRDGFTIEHGLMSRSGRPDTANLACMKDCTPDVKLSSEYPEHARDTHGNLAEQTRALGPVEGARSATSVPQARTVKGPDGADLAKASGCTACHGTTQKIVGPAFRDVAAKYAQDREAEARLVAKIREGGAGVWGSVPMPANPGLKEGDARALAGWILGGAR